MKTIVFCSILLIASVAAAEELAIGAAAPSFSLVNAADGKTISYDPASGEPSVVIFWCNQCPYVKAFEDRTIAIARQYAARGVRFYLVNPNDETKFQDETMENLKARALSKKYPFPYLKDADSSIARAYGARVTPHVFVVDGKGKVRYRGYVDDSAKPAERAHTGLTEALDAVLAGSAVAQASTKAFGCTIKWKS